jgi:hypothetical protein
MKDFIGNEIQVGDTIVYAGRRGSSLWLTEATVLSTGQRAPRWQGDLDMTPTITVQPIVHPTDPFPTRDGLTRTKKPVTITNGSTVCVTKPAGQA